MRGVPDVPVIRVFRLFRYHSYKSINLNADNHIDQQTHSCDRFNSAGVATRDTAPGGVHPRVFEPHPKKKKEIDMKIKTKLRCGPGAPPVIRDVVSGGG
jgi:hypothetical protein